MNPYEAPQTVDKATTETPPKRPLTWGQLALIAVVVTTSQLVIHYFRTQQREQKLEALLKQATQQRQSSSPTEP
jgi:ribosomal silencing factor RsfS